MSQESAEQRAAFEVALIHAPVFKPKPSRLEIAAMMLAARLGRDDVPPYTPIDLVQGATELAQMLIDTDAEFGM